MSGSRIELAFGDQAPQGRILLLGAGREVDLSPFDPAQTQIVQGFFPDVRALEARGFRVVTEAEGEFAEAVVFIPRARALARARIADAAARLPAGAPLWIDGQKTDGIDSVLREIRSLVPVDEVHSRAHGKIFRLTQPEAQWWPEDWHARETVAAPGMITVPGVFSADAPDPASAALAAHLPEKLPTRIVDLGAGWGWLSAQILTHPGVEVLHLVEADAAALACAQRNVTDPRARFHWADALHFSLPEPVNAVIMNPPFHDGRAADPALGVGFIQAAARLLTGAGRLWMVANRHLPYETALRASFADVSELGGDNRFKILTATGAGRGTDQARGRRR
ncbi:class I SAM-dependent methyltransferase [Paracoccus aminophilus]|uniref:Ribosomal RNA small subunit methyltransferase C n=1 Tax=Paracoccus aminophilus JCM 7686 TaxID=1367847 RepID=S5XSW4_PARAH|nr:methyltransferase [Paracoccus aminophilus]AGT08227.1 ribosomal RNA small subunit methyltransferase C [Paracoccus aminophilus JCM 7686]